MALKHPRSAQFECSMSTHTSVQHQEIQSDIEDAIAKYNEVGCSSKGGGKCSLWLWPRCLRTGHLQATSRLAEAEKNKAQADQVRHMMEGKMPQRSD